MPEVNFQVQWSDGTRDTYYSPSSIVKKYFVPDTEYELTEFLTRSRTALNHASDRVKATYGFPCSKALGQLQQIESKASEYGERSDPKVHFLEFIE